MKRDFFHTGLNVSRSQIARVIGALNPGDGWYVDYRNGNDSNGGQSWSDAFKTYGVAVSAATNNNNDIIYIKGDSTVVETSIVNITKNRLHTIGVNGILGHYGQGAKISCSAADGPANIATIQNTGIRNTFIGLKVIGSHTVAQGLYGFAEGGEYSRFFNCEFYKDTDLDQNLAAELLHNGDSAQFYNCTFGSTANTIADNMIRPNVLLTATLSGKKCRDSYFENCLFLSKADGTEHTAIYAANASDVERMLIFKDCTFLNNPLSTATPAHAVGFGAAQTEGAVFLKNCSSVDYTLMAQAAVGIYVDGAVPTFATTGVSVTA